ncbi:MAG: aminotransferase class V-fold PLP-dependent enzyme [Ignavibacteria bacterium]|nr:aminotransferase class V-fold PLP-dependent enzyme [Ignavibacteria bacterium]
MNIDTIRTLFPHLATGQIYFNHASLGPWHEFIFNRLNEYAKERSGNNVMNFESYVKYSQSAKNKLALLLGTVSERIAWVDNVSNAMSLVAQGLNFKHGDRIIINDIEFPANVYPFLNLKKHGIEIDIVKSRNGKVDLEDIAKGVTPNTKLVSISLVQFLSGYRADIKAIGDFCKDKNILFCVDAIQAAGVVNIDIKNMNIDFLCGGTHKWLMNCQCVSYFFMSEELQSMIEQKYVGWASVKNAWNFLDYNLELKDGIDRFQNGTQNEFGVCLLDAALDMFKDFTIGEFETRIIDNSEYFINALSTVGYEPILRDVNRKNLSGIVSVKINDEERIFNFLKRMEVHCAIREGILRFSPHFYNTKDEIDSVIEALKQIEN